MSGIPLTQTPTAPVSSAPIAGTNAPRMADQAGYDRIVATPEFQQLVHERTRFGLILTGLMLFVYFGFIGLIAFDKELLAVKVGGATTSLGLFMGVGVILFAFVLTGLYVARANTRYDALTAALMRSLAR